MGHYYYDDEGNCFWSDFPEIEEGESFDEVKLRYTSELEKERRIYSRRNKVDEHDEIRKFFEKNKEMHEFIKNIKSKSLMEVFLKYANYAESDDYDGTRTDHNRFLDKYLYREMKRRIKKIERK